MERRNFIKGTFLFFVSITALKFLESFYFVFSKENIENESRYFFLSSEHVKIFRKVIPLVIEDINDEEAKYIISYLDHKAHDITWFRNNLKNSLKGKDLHPSSIPDIVSSIYEAYYSSPFWLQESHRPVELKPHISGGKCECFLHIHE